MARLKPSSAACSRGRKTSARRRARRAPRPACRPTQGRAAPTLSPARPNFSGERTPHSRAGCSSRRCLRGQRILRVNGDGPAKWPIAPCRASSEDVARQLSAVQVCLIGFGVFGVATCEALSFFAGEFFLQGRAPHVRDRFLHAEHVGERLAELRRHIGAPLPILTRWTVTRMRSPSVECARRAPSQRSTRNRRRAGRAQPSAYFKTSLVGRTVIVSMLLRRVMSASAQADAEHPARPSRLSVEL